MSYTYVYVEPGVKPPFKKIVKRTRGKLVRVTEPCGCFGFRYAVFRNLRSEVWVPTHDLTPETAAAVKSFQQRSETEIS